MALKILYTQKVNDMSLNTGSDTNRSSHESFVEENNVSGDTSFNTSGCSGSSGSMFLSPSHVFEL